MESGFIYLWFDRKHKRYYLGKHWGSEDDGYVCSSTWMLNAYKRRPEDFGKRKILERVTTNRKDLAEAERRWGLLIKPEELGKRYYNLKRPEDHHWHDDPETRKTVGQKISKSIREKIQNDPEYRAKQQASLAKACRSPKPGRKLSEDHIAKVVAKHQGRKRSEETRKRMKEAQMLRRQKEKEWKR